MRSCGHHPLQVHLLLRAGSVFGGLTTSVQVVILYRSICCCELNTPPLRRRMIALLSSTGPFVVASPPPAPWPQRRAGSCYPLQVHLLLRACRLAGRVDRFDQVVILYRSICCCERPKSSPGESPASLLSSTGPFVVASGRRGPRHRGAALVVILYRSICCCETPECNSSGPVARELLSSTGPFVVASCEPGRGCRHRRGRTGCYPLQVHLLLRAPRGGRCRPTWRVAILYRSICCCESAAAHEPDAYWGLLSSTGPFVVASARLHHGFRPGALRGSASGPLVSGSDWPASGRPADWRGL